MLRQSSIDKLPLAEVRRALDMMLELTSPYIPQATAVWEWSATGTCRAGWAFHAVGQPRQTILAYNFEGEDVRVEMKTFHDLSEERGIPPYHDASNLRQDQVDFLKRLFKEDGIDISGEPEDGDIMQMVIALYKRGLVEWHASRVEISAGGYTAIQ